MRWPFILALFCAASFGQEFEVASVKPSPPGAPRVGTDGGPGTRGPERFTAKGMDLRIVTCIAYAVADCQQQVVGPGWIDSEKYDIAANVPRGASREQFQKMLQNLIIERFKLALHHETRTLPVYELEVAKNGPKLKKSAGTDPPSLTMSFRQGSAAHWTARQQTTADLAKALGLPNGAGRQVIDKTGLSGKYDFELSYQVELLGAPIPDNATEPVLKDALEDQLGLKLVDGKAPFDFVIIERGEKVPVEN